jgi:hypothetical protein
MAGEEDNGNISMRSAGQKMRGGGRRYNVMYESCWSHLIFVVLTCLWPSLSLPHIYRRTRHPNTLSVPLDMSM